MLDRNVASELTHPAAWRRALMLIAALLSMGAAEALGQAARTTAAPPKTTSAWKEIRPAEPRNGRVEGPKMLRGGEITDQKLFDDYWKYVVSQVTWENEDQAEHRKQFKQLMRSGKDPARARAVKNIALPLCRQIAKSGDYSPRARCNAVLLIGELNDVEPVPGGPPQISLAAARPALLEFFGGSMPVDDVHDALRNVAMVGFLNHLERGGISDEKEKKQVIAAMQTLLKSKDPPAGRSPEVHQWLQRRAKEVVASLNGGEVVRGG